jgi:hypothetical protein
MVLTTEEMVNNLAFDIFGINKINDIGSQDFCLRFNIWKWNDFRIILHEFNMFSVIDESCFMSNDGYEIYGNEADSLFSAIENIQQIERLFRSGSGSWISNILSKKKNINLREYSISPMYDGMDQFGMSDIDLLCILTSRFGGIKIL